MNKSFSICSTLLVVVLLFGGCASRATPSVEVADTIVTVNVTDVDKERLDQIFNISLEHVIEGRYWYGYKVAVEGKKEFLATNHVLPARYSALLHLAAEKSVEQSVRMMRLFYYTTRLEFAAEEAVTALLVAKEEHIQIPEQARYIMRKIIKGRQQMYLLNYPENPSLKI